MITLLKNIVILIVTLIFLLSCNQDSSLQSFMVKQQEQNDVISFDLTSDMLSLQEGMNTPENEEVLKSIKKANILAYQIDTLNIETYDKEKQQLTEIFKNEKYQELMRMGKGSNGVRVYSVGDGETLDELVVYANDNTKGWALVRVIGDHMQPDKILKLVNKIHLEDKQQLDKISDIFKN